MTIKMKILLRTAALCGCLLGVAARAEAAPHWGYCTLNSTSEVWVSPVVVRDGPGGMEQVKAEFVRLVTQQFPSLHPAVYQSAACFGDSPDYEGYDEAQMLQVRTREMKQYSSVHEVQMGPAPSGKHKGKK